MNGASVPPSDATGSGQTSGPTTVSVEYRSRSMSPTSAWPKLVAAAVLTGFCALSVHVVMLEFFHVPYPHGYPLDGLLPFLTAVALTLAATVFTDLTAPKLTRLPSFARCGLLFLILATLREQLIRKPLMESVVTTAWAHAFIANIPMLVPYLVVAILVTVATPRLNTLTWKLAGGIACAVGAFAVAGPLFDWAFRPVFAAIVSLDHPEVCTHGPCVEIPAYLSFIEPVTAAFVVAAFVWPRLSCRPAIRLLQFTLLLMTMDLSFFRPLVWGFDDPSGFWSGMLSVSQFWLEHLVLALGTAWSWSRFGAAAQATS